MGLKKTAMAVLLASCIVGAGGATAAVATDGVPVIQEVRYVPGQASSWHTHPAVHVVEVLSGTITIYDEHCQPMEFGPGQTYVGGELAHLAYNGTATEVLMRVSYYSTATHDVPSPCTYPLLWETT